MSHLVLVLISSNSQFGKKLIEVFHEHIGDSWILNISANAKLYQGDMRDQDWLNRV